jgi:hypothetical protein
LKLFLFIFSDHDFAIPGGGQSSDQKDKMTNADFRKMMMTPRTSGPATLGPLGSGSSTPSMTPKDDKGKNSCNNVTTNFFSCP